ncbi:MAG: U32 family peptidase [Prevotella sp.]|nr:U32 family peptidase [Bacteroides sp.]MCM1366729.1 U32 family peptidase [Prevotella sp.]MCM1437033.1 U32 family peptidase [Prevotella sp.]
MGLISRPIELLAPARDINVGREAILHGADAVYIGASSHGARRLASNSIDDIRELTKFAHQYRARVYVTVNTIIYEEELRIVRDLICRLYEAGVDALIVQDMGILRLDIPPIELHASTQCDTRTASKAKFLEDVGFSQIVLARELTIGEIREICNEVSVPVECFIHGALCVSYSGRCSAGFCVSGRSANRGECPQICRLPFTLKDGKGNVIESNKHLLSLKDFNASYSISDMLRAGVSSFKIEGRLKDASYVKNITAYYRQLIDSEIMRHPQLYNRSSVGKTSYKFIPNPSKSFNRGFTDYFLNSRRPRCISSIETPKSLGEKIKDFRDLENGDGISFFDNKGNYSGAYINGISKDGILLLSTGKRIKLTTGMRLTYDKSWEKELSAKTAERRIGLNLSIDRKGITAEDERGVKIRIPLETELQPAKKRQDFHGNFSKLGNSIYVLNKFSDESIKDSFIPASALSQLRRKMVELLDKTNEAVYPLKFRRAEQLPAKYPLNELTYTDNVSNSLARRFYKEHGVDKIADAIEMSECNKIPTGTRIMTTRHCILRELGMCIKEKKNPPLPLTLKSERVQFLLEFDCGNCEMHVLK